MHIQNVDELYQTEWRPTAVDNVPAFPPTIPPAPAPSESVANTNGIVKPVASKPAGAYRPPGARGLATPAIFKREDEGGPVGSQTPPGRYSRSPAPGAPLNGHGQNGTNGRRHVPGAAPKSSSPGPNGQIDGDRKANRRKKGGKDGEREERRRREPREVGNGRGEPAYEGRVEVNGSAQAPSELQIPPIVVDGSATAAGSASGSVPPTPGGDGTLDPIAKKVRNLSKKLKAIDELKEKAKRGERLEATQLKKIDGEADIRKELAGLAVS